MGFVNGRRQIDLLERGTMLAEVGKAGAGSARR
jgi:hypothetical protein